ncbi:AAA family ATPase [Cohnella herbarum]|uniref:AAA family ATPase n=1 Tax=Cohnella herbarum TaxID=2728023 RepID=A0A7Z2ZL46_9BACL|nr:AAA family ATPase [Cohnella herbarum]QJD83841.1 AAA family ATPase [Cohnella herbarum]
MASCHTRLLGGLNITIDAEEMRGISGNKVKLLLAYLLLSIDMPQTRKQIAFDFWPESTEKQALSNLRKLLHDLRTNVPQIDRYLNVTPAYIHWNDKLPFHSDVREFVQLAKGTSLHELRTAEDLYKGELLPGYYEEWLGLKRELLARTYLNVLDKLIAILEHQRDYSSALFYANKMLIHNRLSEESYRTLMRLHALNKDKAGLMQTYRQLIDVLQAELGIEPAEETVRLWDKLNRNGIESPTASSSQTPLVGRVGEWGTLLSAWKEATVGDSALLILKGEAGIGKTRLALEFQAWLESRGIQTAFAGCYPSMKALSYTPITAWLRSLPLPKLDPAALSELSRLLPELSERYSDLPKPNPVLESWQLNQWYEAIERMLLAKQPLMLILDDMQWSDEETLQLLSYILRGDSDAKLLVIATMRTDEHPGDSVNHLISNVRIERKLTEIDLAPLSEEETKRLMVEAVGGSLANRHASGLHADTGGNPLFIMETLREWQLDGGDNGYRLSPLVESIIENRLRKLAPEYSRLVSAIAAFGRPVSAAFMALVTNTEEEAALERIERLEHMKILQDAGGGNYDFSHEMVRETEYKLNNESRRRRIHGQIARSLTVFHRERLEAFAAEVAFHYELAGMDSDAVVYYEMASDAAEKMYANETRINYYKKLCVLLPPTRILPILMKLGDALIIVGRWGEAERTYRQWLERSGNSAALQERSFCDLALGNCLRLQGKYEEAMQYLERARRCFELMDDPSGLDSIYVTLGMLHYYMGNYDNVLYYQKRRAELPQADQSKREDSRFFGIIGHLYYDQCEYDQAIHWIKKQIKLAADSEDKYAIEQAMGTLAMVHMDIDEMDRAFDLIADKMTISKSIGDRMGYAIAQCMLGKYYGYLGHYELASRCIAYALEEAVAVSDLRAVAIALSYEGRNLMAQGRLEQSELLFDRSVRLFNQLRTPYFACETLYFLSLLRQNQHRYESAVETAEEALRMAERIKRKEMQVNLRVHLSLLNVEMERLSAEQAMDELRGLLERYPDRQNQATVRFAMWKVVPDSTEYRASALLLNEELSRKSGKREYNDRCRELNGTGHAAAARPMPQLAAESARDRRITPNLLTAIDRCLNGEYVH